MRRQLAITLGWLAAILLAAALPAGGAAAQIELARTHRDHLQPLRLAPLELPQLSAPTRFEQSGGIVLRSDKPVAANATLERRLSDLCRYNLFRQRADGWYTALFADGNWGAAFGSGVGLFDPGELADRGRLYLFRRAGTTACEVRSMPRPESVAARAG